MQRTEIKTMRTDNPTPNRDMDWQATFGDYDLDDPIGLGSTPEAAVSDLKDRVED